MEIKRINIKGKQIGVIGLSETFEELKNSQISDENRLKEYLLQKVKEHNYVPAPAEDDYKVALYKEYRRFLGETIEEEETGLVIKILGPGCPACEKLQREVVVLLQELNLPADIEHVRDLKEISKYGIFGTPVLIINRKVKCSGRVPMRSQLKEWILEAVSALKKLQK